MESSKKVLIVDDSKINFFIISEFLNSWRIRFECVDNGFQAIAAAENTDYDHILMDLNMLERDGYMASKTIKALGKARQPYIIAFSAMDIKEVHEKLEASGIQGFVHKPFRAEELIKVL